jgi:hypothetical protein
MEPAHFSLPSLRGAQRRGNLDVPDGRNDEIASPGPQLTRFLAYDESSDMIRADNRRFTWLSF